MTPEQIKDVKLTWTKVLLIEETAADLFYKKLFELDPTLRQLFKSDIKGQGQKLMATINVAVQSLDNLSAIVPAVEDLGRRHNDYGVSEKDYDTVGAALIWTLDQGLGKDFTDEVKQAWIEVYTLLADTMKNAANVAA